MSRSWCSECSKRSTDLSKSLFDRAAERAQAHWSLSGKSESCCPWRRPHVARQRVRRESCSVHKHCVQKPHPLVGTSPAAGMCDVMFHVPCWQHTVFQINWNLFKYPSCLIYWSTVNDCCPVNPWVSTPTAGPGRWSVLRAEWEL